MRLAGRGHVRAGGRRRRCRDRDPPRLRDATRGRPSELAADLTNNGSGGDMDEMYRMLGREHEADLEREADKRRRAAEVGGGRLGHAPSPIKSVETRVHRTLARISALLRAARAEA